MQSFRHCKGQRCQMVKYRNRKASKDHSLWGAQGHLHKVRPALYTSESSGPKHNISWKNIQIFNTNEKWQRSFKGIPDRPGAGLGDSGLLVYAVLSLGTAQLLQGREWGTQRQSSCCDCCFWQQPGSWGVIFLTQLNKQQFGMISCRILKCWFEVDCPWLSTVEADWSLWLYFVFLPLLPNNPQTPNVLHFVNRTCN